MYTSPPDQIYARSVKISVKDLTNFDRHEVQPYSTAHMSQTQVAIAADKQIVVPSMGPLTEIFLTHMNTLRKLK
jgi:hypothetical protein